MKFLFSRRAWIIYSWFLIAPLIITLLWLLIPVHRFRVFAFSSSLFFSVSYLVWISFNDFVIPGSSKKYLTLCFVVFVVPTALWLNWLGDQEARNNKYYYFIINLFTLVATSLSFLGRIIYVKYLKKKTEVTGVPYFQELKDKPQVKNEEDSVASCTDLFSSWLCFRPSIDRLFLKPADCHPLTSPTPPPINNNYNYDNNNYNNTPPAPTTTALILSSPPVSPLVSYKPTNPTEKQQPQQIELDQLQSTEQQQQQQQQQQQTQTNNTTTVDPDDISLKMTTGMPRPPSAFSPPSPNLTTNTPTYNSTPTTYQQPPNIDPNNPNNTNSNTNPNITISMEVAKLPDTLTWQTFGILIGYQISILACWLWLTSFTGFFVVTSSVSTGIAVASVIVYQISRIIFLSWCSFLNDMLTKNTKSHVIPYFTVFQLQVMFLLFYRTLFLSFSGWTTTILVSIITFVFDIVYYCLQMTKFVYEWRNITLRKWLESKFNLPEAVKTALWPLSTYEHYYGVLCVEYFYEKVGEYYGMVTTIIFISLLRVMNYQGEIYLAFQSLTPNDYSTLMFRYLYLLCFEGSTDLLLRFSMKKFLKIDISHKGRTKTISYFKTRFLFTIFVVYNLMNVYYSQVVPDF